MISKGAMSRILVALNFFSAWFSLHSLPPPPPRGSKAQELNRRALAGWELPPSSAVQQQPFLPKVALASAAAPSHLQDSPRGGGSSLPGVPCRLPTLSASSYRGDLLHTTHSFFRRTLDFLQLRFHLLPCTLPN